MNEKIVPHQSSSKLVFIILGIILIVWSTLLSILLIIQGAWPVSLFLGAEYFLIFYLVRFYFKENIINDQININEKEISIQKYKNNKLFYSLKLNTYWSKVFFYKNENKSRLTIRESNKEAEVASFLHSNIKESLYNKISKQINYYN